jgi:hypothetical protein
MQEKLDIILKKDPKQVDGKIFKRYREYFQKLYDPSQRSSVDELLLDDNQRIPPFVKIYKLCLNI